MGALDLPTRGYKTYIDLHCDKNEEESHSWYLPSQLGWLSLYPPSVVEDELPNNQVRFLFGDDIDYIGTKSIAYNSGLSYVSNVDEAIINRFPIINKYSQRINQYEELRKSDYFSDKIKEKLKDKGKEYSLLKDKYGNWNFVEMSYNKQKVFSLKNERNYFIINNPFEPQKPGIHRGSLFIRKL